MPKVDVYLAEKVETCQFSLGAEKYFLKIPFYLSLENITLRAELEAFGST